MTLKTLTLAAIVALLVVPVSAQTPVLLRIEVPSAVYAAAIQRVGLEADAAAQQTKVEAWVLKTLTNDLAQELAVVRLDEAQAEAVAGRSLTTKLKSLDATRCAAVAKTLGVDVSTLPCRK